MTGDVRTPNSARPMTVSQHSQKQTYKGPYLDGHLDLKSRQHPILPIDCHGPVLSPAAHLLASRKRSGDYGHRFNHGRGKRGVPRIGPCNQADHVPR